MEYLSTIMQINFTIENNKYAKYSIQNILLLLNKFFNIIYLIKGNYHESQC